MNADKWQNKNKKGCGKRGQAALLRAGNIFLICSNPTTVISSTARKTSPAA